MLQLMLQILSMDTQPGEFVQILNVANSHWVTISTIGCKAGTVNVYDSGGKRRKKRSDCGLFAVAFATSLCEAGGEKMIMCFKCRE